jgi:hypothetical protein
MVCTNASFSNGGGIALTGDAANFGSNVVLSTGFSAEGAVRFNNATIGGDLICTGGKFLNRFGASLNANSANVAYHVFLNDEFVAEGGVNLSHAVIGGDLDCGNGAFRRNGHHIFALQASSAKIGHSLHLDNGFKAEGEVLLTLATIGGDLICDGGYFSNDGAVHEAINALNAHGTEIMGKVSLGSKFTGAGTVIFAFSNVHHEFILQKINAPNDLILDLRFAKVATLLNAKPSWPRKDHLFLHGFVFEGIDSEAPLAGCEQVQWLHRQASESIGQENILQVQPYDQLAGTLRRMGLEEEWREVMIAKNRHAGRDALAKDASAPIGTKITNPIWLINFLLDLGWYKVLGKLIGFGYRPWNAFYASVVIVMFGTFFFGFGHKHRIIIPTDEKAWFDPLGRQLKESYPKFSAPIYALETFVPLVKLAMEEYWIPNANGEVKLGGISISGKWWRRYLWFHMMSGWVLTTLWVAGFTGLLKT